MSTPSPPRRAVKPVQDHAELHLMHFPKCTDSGLQLMHFRNAPATYFFGWMVAWRCSWRAFCVGPVGPSCCAVCAGSSGPSRCGVYVGPVGPSCCDVCVGPVEPSCCRLRSTSFRKALAIAAWRWSSMEFITKKARSQSNVIGAC